MWNKVASIGSQAAIATTSALNVHEYRPFSPVPVLAGDIVGIHQPYTSTSALQVYYQDHGPLNYYQPALADPKNTLSTGNTLVLREDRQPLLAIEFSESWLHQLFFKIAVLSGLVQRNCTLTHAHIYYVYTGAERVTTLATLTLTSSQIKSTSTSIQPSAITSPWTRPSNSPSPVPDVHRQSFYLVVIIGVAVAVLVLLAVIVLAIVIGVIRCKGCRAHTVDRQVSASGMLCACSVV